MPQPETSANQQSPIFEKQVREFESAVAEDGDIRSLAANLLDLINNYPDSDRGEHAPALTDDLREVTLEGALHQLSGEFSQNALRAFIHEARKQLAMTLDESAPAYVQWLRKMSDRNRELLTEAFANRFGEPPVPQPESGADDLDRSFGPLLRGEPVSPGRPEGGGLTPEDEFKRDVNNAVDIAALRQTLDDRSLDLEESITRGGKALGDVERYLMKMHGPDRYHAWIELIKDGRVPEELKSKLKRIFDSQVLSDIDHYARSDDPDIRRKIEGYYPFFSESWLAGRVRRLFEGESSDDFHEDSRATVLEEPRPGEAVWSGKTLEQLTADEFTEYLKDQRWEAERRLLDHAKRIKQMLPHLHEAALNRLKVAEDAAAGSWIPVHNNSELVAPFAKAQSNVADSMLGKSIKNLMLDALAPQFFQAFCEIGEGTWRNRLPEEERLARKAPDIYRNSPHVVAQRLIKHLKSPNEARGHISAEVYDLMLMGYNQVVMEDARKALNFPARTHYRQGEPLEKALFLVNTFVYGRDHIFEQALKAKMAAVLKEEDAHISGSK